MGLPALAGGRGGRRVLLRHGRRSSRGRRAGGSRHRDDPLQQGLGGCRRHAVEVDVHGLFSRAEMKGSEEQNLPNPRNLWTPKIQARRTEKSIERLLK
jgi:hypothetical protein